MKISKNEAILKKEMIQVSSHIKSVKQTLKRSANTILAQKALYSKLTKLTVDRLPRHWNQQWLSESDLLSPSSLPRHPRETEIDTTQQAINSMQKAVGNLKLQMCRVSEDLHQWDNDLQQLYQANTNLLLSNIDLHHDVAECFDSSDSFDFKQVVDSWEPFPYKCKPPSSRFKCRKIYNKRF